MRLRTLRVVNMKHQFFFFFFSSSFLFLNLPDTLRATVIRSLPSKSHTVNSAVFVPFLFFWLCYIIARSENRVETDVYFI